MSADETITYFDTQLPDPFIRTTTLITKIATGICLVYFSVHELAAELKAYRTEKEAHGFER